MLTIATINPKQAEEYYQQENYYSKGAALENSEWFGRGAAKLELSGEIADNQVYKNLVNGLSPDGKQALRGKPKGFSKEQSQAKSPNKQSKKQKKQSQERAGVDLTFSAPKSVSLACLVGGEKRLEEAHRRAVKRTLEFIEKYYPQTRIKKQRIQTDNLTVALWHHDTSRELDPHLHTHCILMNFTALPDGTWQSRTDENLYFNKMLLGQIYRQELANECRALGYEIEPQPKELFEIKGYTRQQIEAFSKRHEQIVKYLEEREIDVNTESKVWAWRRTRVKKNHEMGRIELLDHWHEEADLYGIVHPTPVTEVQSATTTKLEVTQDEKIEPQLQTAIGVAIEHCSERKVAFKQEDILKFVTAQVKPFSVSQLEQAIPQYPELIRTYDGRYTTQTASARELATIKLMQEGKGQVSPIATPETIDNYLADKSLTSGQRKAVALTATTSDQFIAWQGVAGAGKTYALNQVKQVATALNQIAPGYSIKGFAPSAEAAKVLGEELGIEANTVARLLISKQLEKPPPNQIWIVDEAGLLSAKNAHALLQRATQEKARVILVGDIRQHSAIEAGNPFKSLQSAGIATAYLDESLRQKPPDLQKAVGLAANGQIGEALSHLQQLERIEEVADAQERTGKMAADYISLPPQERQETLIVAGTHAERSAITEQIRTALKEEGTLGYGVKVTQLRARQDLTSIQTRYTHNYNVGDVVVPIREYKRLGLHKSQPYRVEAIRGDKLHLQDLVGNQLVVDPMKFRKTLYKQENIDIANGDRLRWTRNDKELGRRNGQEFTVTGIEGQTATIELDSGKTDTIDLYAPLHLDHALVATTYSSQGKTADRVLVSSTVDATVSTESVYVAISRAKYDLKIYAENIDYLLEQAQESKAQETVWEVLHPQAKVQVAAESARATNPVPAVERSVGIAATSKLSKKNSASVINIERPLKRQNPKVALKAPIPKKEPPKQLEVFWQPTSAPQAPPQIEAKHWHELVEGSAIHPDIAAANFRSLQMGSIEQEHEAWEYLMYSPKLERTNTGQLTTGYLKRYAHIEAGGWWCNSGANALSFSNLETGNKPQEKIWGCYKPNEPRSNPDKPGKVIKYEHPPKVDLGIFLLHVPNEIAQKIYAKADIDPTSEDRMRGFWYCTWKYNLPVTITEGAKKAASLLGQGHAAIGLPGIYAGYRSKDEQGNPIKAYLHEELAVFATLGRNISFCFDFETRLETKRNIEIAISRTGSLLQQQGAKVSVVSLPGPEKGVDDLIVACSPLAYEQAAMAALPLRQWREHNKQGRHLAIVPPKKLSVQERKEQLKDSSSGQQPPNYQNLNQSPEQISHDSINRRQLEPERATDGGVNQSHNLIDQENRPVGENQQPTYEQLWSIERTNPAPGNYPNRKPERIENQSLELLTAINRYLEFQTVEQLGADLAELNRSLANGGLRDQGAAFLSSSLDQQDSTAIDRAAGDENVERRGFDDERTIGQSINAMLDTAGAAIANYIEAETVTQSAIAQDIQNVCQDIVGYQSQRLTEVIRELDAALESELSQVSPEVAPRIVAPSQAARAISNYLAERTVVEAPLTQELLPLSQQLKELQHQGLTNAIHQLTEVIEEAISLQPKEQLEQEQLNEQSIQSVVTYTQQQAIALLLVQPLTDLTQQLTQGRTQLPDSLKELDKVISDYLQRAIGSLARHEQQIITGVGEAVSKHVDQSAVETLPLVEVFADLTQQLKSNSGRADVTINQLDEVISGYLGQIEPLLKEKQQQITNIAISSIFQHIDLSAISSTLATQACKQIEENLRMLQTANNTKALKKVDAVVAAQNKETEIALAPQLRDLPLDEIAPRLGLNQDKHDKHKWRSEGQIISINDQKFYDHANLKGGYGAIDLVMHVQGRDFKEALRWLADSSLELPPVPVRSPKPQVIERQPFQPPTPDESKWLAVRQYLTQKRQLPAALVDELHSQGKVYADAKQNAVFLRQDTKGSITGASLRGTYKGSSFKGLATGSQHDNGWFSFTQGEGELKRIVLVESAIDAISAAALAEQPGKAIFVSTDGAGSVPTSWLKQQQQQGVEIVAAHDRDRAGEEMAWRLATEISSVTRAVPTYGKDWNEQLLDRASKLDSSEWKLVAQAIGKSDAYVNRVVTVVGSGQPLPTEASIAMQQDFAAYKQLSNDLWQWHQVARASGYSEAYLKRIASVAIALHHSKSPKPLSKEALNAMQQDVKNYSQVHRNYHHL